MIESNKSQSNFYVVLLYSNQSMVSYFFQLHNGQILLFFCETSSIRSSTGVMLSLL